MKPSKTTMAGTFVGAVIQDFAIIIILASFLQWSVSYKMSEIRTMIFISVALEFIFGRKY